MVGDVLDLATISDMYYTKLIYVLLTELINPSDIGTKNVSKYQGEGSDMNRVSLGFSARSKII